MLKPVAITACLFGLATAFGSDRAAAQSSTSTCIGMGSNMVHCDTMDMSSSNATAGPDSGTELGRGIARLIVRTREDAFRKRVGKLMADGDCQGAARLALESGRLELGQSIMAACSPNNGLGAAAPTQ
jgi:hypothetical protein